MEMNADWILGLARKTLRLSARAGMTGAVALSLFTVTPVIVAPSVHSAQAESCSHRKREKLGVHRTIEVSRRHGFYLGTGRSGSIGLRPKELVLTFDDGPRPGITEPILRALEAECTQATFFALGRAARAHPELLRRVAREGHTIATHTQTHPVLPDEESAVVSAEIRNGIRSINRALRGSGYRPSNFFRYPYLARSERTDALVRDYGLVVFDMFIDSLDWKRTSPEELLDRVLNRVRSQGSGVILFHDIQHRTAAILPEFLRTIREEGYKIVHIVPGDRDRAALGTHYRGPALAPRPKPDLILTASINAETLPETTTAAEVSSPVVASEPSEVYRTAHIEAHRYPVSVALKADQGSIKRTEAIPDNVAVDEIVQSITPTDSNATIATKPSEPIQNVQDRIVVATAPIPDVAIHDDDKSGITEVTLDRSESGLDPVTIERNGESALFPLGDVHSDILAPKPTQKPIREIVSNEIQPTTSFVNEHGLQAEQLGETFVIIDDSEYVTLERPRRSRLFSIRDTALTF